jgi:thiamine-monophosphate kinase
VVGSGDDAAVVERAGLAVTSVDALVEEVHFRIPPFTPAQAGAKALATALSDLAAMGARPSEAYVQLGLPERFEDEALAIADGLAVVAAACGVVIAGGDVTRSRTLFLAVTAVGSAAAEPGVVRRGGARDGDAIAITGEVGGAAAGLMLLERPALGAGLDPSVAERLRTRQLEPRPRLAAGEALARAGASAMIDVSDGVAADAAHLAEASGVAARIEVELVPRQVGVDELATAAGIEAVELALGGGEDYELLVTIAPEHFDAATAALASIGETLTAIGSIGPGRGVELSEAGARRGEIAGFDQLAGRPTPGPG